MQVNVTVVCIKWDPCGIYTNPKSHMVLWSYMGSVKAGYLPYMTSYTVIFQLTKIETETKIMNFRLTETETKTEIICKTETE